MQSSTSTLIYVHGFFRALNCSTKLSKYRRKPFRDILANSARGSLRRSNIKHSHLFVDAGSGAELLGVRLFRTRNYYRFGFLSGLRFVLMENVIKLFFFVTDAPNK
jgi:hypothetical protein